MSTVNIRNTEIFSQPHQMWAEGKEDKEPCLLDIHKLLLESGFRPKGEIELSYDNFMKLHCWFCEIEKIKPETE